MRQPDNTPHPPPRPAIRGRGTVLALLTEMVLDGDALGRRVAVVDGPIGCGRSTVLTELAARARDRGAVVRYAQADARDRDLRFNIAAQLLAARTIAGLGRAVERLGRTRPVVLMVDDAQWCDTDSLRWLARLAGRPGQLPLSIVVSTARGTTGELAELGRHARWCVLGELGFAEAGQLITDRLGTGLPAGFDRACYAYAGGSPLLLTALLDLVESGVVDPAVPLARPGSTWLGQLLLRRLATVDPAAEVLLRAVATLGAVPDDIAAAAGGLSSAKARDLVGVLVADNLLVRTSPDRIAVRYDLVRDSVLALTTFVDRQDFHLRAATALHDRHAPAETIAGHLVAAPIRLGTPWATTTLRAAAATALAAGDPETARACLDRVLVEQPDVPAHLVELGLVEVGIAPAAAVGHLSTALRCLDKPEQLVRAAAGLAGALLECGRIPDSLAVLDDAIVRVHAELAEQLSAFRASVAAWALPGQLGHQDSPAAMAFARSIGIAGADQPVELGRPALCAHHVLSDHICVSFALLHGEAYEAVRAQAEIQLAHARHSGLLSAVVWSYALRGLAEHSLGQHATGTDSARSGLAVVADRTGSPLLGVELAVAVLVGCLTAQSAYPRARQVLHRYRLDGQVPELWSGNHVLYQRGILRLAMNDLRAGLADLLECGDRLRRWGAVNPAVLNWRSWAAIALARLGDRAGAVDLARQEVGLARQVNAPETLATALVVQDVLSGVGPDRRAFALLRDRGRQVLVGQLELLADSTPTAAVAQLLSPHEQRLVGMALDGATNDDIAREFSVSRRAIEFHFTQIYRKLGISRRTQLHQAMAS